MPSTPLAFSGDGTVLATSSLDGTICLWDTSTGTQIQTLSGHKGPVYSVAFSPSGKQLSSAGYGDKTVRVWNVETGQCDRVFEGHTSSVQMVAYAHDERRLVSCSRDGSLRLWDTLADAKVVQSPGQILYHNAADNIITISIPPDKRLILFGSYIKSEPAYEIGPLDMTTRAVLWKCQSAGGRIIALSFSSDRSRMLSGESAGRICLWDTALALSHGDKDALLEEFHSPHGIFDHVSFSADQKSVISDTSFHPINAREHWPHCASVKDHQVSPMPPPVYLLFADWIWCAGPEGNKRICWIPAEYRARRSRSMVSRETNMAVFGSKIAFRTESERLVLIDLSNCANITELL